MKNKILVMLCLFVSGIAFAQSSKRPVEERIHAMRIAHITDAIQLSPEQSQTFWPIYNEHDKKHRQLKRKGKPNRDIENISEQEAEQMLYDHIETETQLFNLKKEYVHQLRSVLSAKQIILLHRAEREFRKQLLRRMRDRDRNRRQRE